MLAVANGTIAVSTAAALHRIKRFMFVSISRTYADQFRPPAVVPLPRLLAWWPRSGAQNHGAAAGQSGRAPGLSRVRPVGW